jgi:hypothetical protein
MLIRYILTEPVTSKYVMSIYAERCEKASLKDETETQHFYVGETVVASIDNTTDLIVSDSGGRLREKGIDYE